MCLSRHCRSSTIATIAYRCQAFKMKKARIKRWNELVKVTEVADRASFLSNLSEKVTKPSFSHYGNKSRAAIQCSNVYETLKIAKEVAKSGLLTYLLHCEARMASFLGLGFYTIGPCGEELIAGLAPNMKAYDLTALHYRHLATSIHRQIIHEEKSIEDIALDRARGYCCSILDPVTNGRHCSLGGNPKTEFLVTSTLASQVPPAVGRALSISLSQTLLPQDVRQFDATAISVVSLGDGSLNNAHFLGGLNLAKYALHNRIKCPVVFVITDNDICISLKGTGYAAAFVSDLAKSNFNTYSAHGQDLFDIMNTSKECFDYTRQSKRPSLLYIHSLPRRFGHAATDRQFAYYTPEQIHAIQAQNPLHDTFAMLIQQGVFTLDEVKQLFSSMQTTVEAAFDQASTEPKITSREKLMTNNSAPLPQTKPSSALFYQHKVKSIETTTKQPMREVMRKHMTRIFDEALSNDPTIIYLGEDVQHGGYYIVTEGLASKYPRRVRDFPPDETTLLGAAMGFAQAGFTPIVEIPYAKYLDCAADMFYEACIMYWLSVGKQNNGMVIRLQGFDKGIFGGNFHTHNMLSFPPGLDVVCFSNGADYTRGMRYLLYCAKQGRVVMSVDSTDLLNKRHVHDEEKDEMMLRPFNDASNTCENYDFNQIIVYEESNKQEKKRKQLVIVSYGNGILTALQARKELQQQSPNLDITIIDSPCLSQTPAQLKAYFDDKKDKVDYLLLADVCKHAPGMPMAMRLLDLQQGKHLQNVQQWQVIGAANTYNPLGTYLTFLSVDDILAAAKVMAEEQKK